MIPTFTNRCKIIFSNRCKVFYIVGTYVDVLLLE
nr:MAG TPA: hypothetical protein [Caudoviricetes sp.]